MIEELIQELTESQLDELLEMLDINHGISSHDDETWEEKAEHILSLFQIRPDKVLEAIAKITTIEEKEHNIG